jgi:hypothetical protein
MGKNIIWLASYPKSGNTWFRAFLSVLLYPEYDLNINQLISLQVNSATVFEAATGLNASELHLKEVEELMPLVAQYLSKEAEDSLIYLKTHEKFRLLANDQPVLPPEQTKMVLYFVRNPLDIAPSYANHNGQSIDQAINRMAKEERIGTKTSRQAREFFTVPHLYGSWSSHVEGWVNCSTLPVTVIKYEDMKQNTVETFSKAVKAIGLEYSQQEIKQALQRVRFDKLQEQEKQGMFTENPYTHSGFFRQGKTGNWRQELTNEQVDRIICDHKKVMQLMGYLTPRGQIIDGEETPNRNHKL